MVSFLFIVITRTLHFIIITAIFLQDKFRRMLQLQSRLGDYFELIRPGRDLIKEGELQKVSRKGVGPRYFILLRYRPYIT